MQVLLKTMGEDPAQLRFGLLEALIPITQSNLDRSRPYQSIAKRLANSKGFATIGQCFLSSPKGRALLPRALPTKEFRSSSPSDADFARVLRSLIQQDHFEALLLWHIISFQEDAGALNLVLQQQQSGMFHILLIDTEDSFPECSSFDVLDSQCPVHRKGIHLDTHLLPERVENDAHDNDEENTCACNSLYAYPLVLEMPSCTKVLSDAAVELIFGWDLEKFGGNLRSMFPMALTAKQRKEAKQRLRRMKEVVLRTQLAQRDTSLRELAFEIMPVWRAAFKRAERAGHCGPVRSLHELDCASRSHSNKTRLLEGGAFGRREGEAVRLKRIRQRQSLMRGLNYF
jgi:hypothetical protein